jgi:FkbM family methyltransferase
MTTHAVVPDPGRLGRSGAGAPAACVARALIRRSRLVRSVVRSPAVQRQIGACRGVKVVRGAARFAVLELMGTGTGRYDLRDSGLAVHVRHRTGDVVILNKIFARDAGRNSYEPPPQVAALLDAAPSPRILDVGANIGLFGVFAFGRWPTARVTAFEPEPSNRRVLRATVAANDVAGSWRVVGAAVSNAPGELRFVPGLGAKAHIASAHEDGTITVPKVDLFEEQGDGAELIKMDMEGGEWAVLADPRFAELKTPAIRLEWHTIHCPQSDARQEAIRLLRVGGFEHIVDADHEHERNGVLWAWRAAG